MHVPLIAITNAARCIFIKKKYLARIKCNYNLNLFNNII